MFKKLIFGQGLSKAIRGILRAKNTPKGKSFRSNLRLEPEVPSVDMAEFPQSPPTGDTPSRAAVTVTSQRTLDSQIS